MLGFKVPQHTARVWGPAMALSMQSRLHLPAVVQELHAPVRAHNVSSPTYTMRWLAVTGCCFKVEGSTLHGLRVQAGHHWAGNDELRPMSAVCIADV